MPVTVHQLLVPVGVFVDKVSPEKEIRVGKELLRLPVGNEAMVGPQDNHPAGKLLYCVQILSAKDQAFAFICPVYQEINEIPLAPRVQTGRRLVKEEDLGM